MPQTFRSFVIFAGMRTGSNLLEATLNAHDLACMGEAFNPYFMGWPDQSTMYGMTLAERDADPVALWQHLVNARKVKGFRYFHDHDPRIFDAVMADPSCAKIILTRNPLDSYVSTRLAWDTNQWKLNATETPIPAAITFDSDEFQRMTAEAEAFHLRILRGLQTSGQTGFWLGYDDLRDAEVMTGLVRWLGRTDIERAEPASDQVPQNPREMASKVRNLDAMHTAIAAMDPFQTNRIPSFEPRRGPAVPSFTALDAGQGLLFQPVRGAADLRDWMARIGPVTDTFTQNTLRQWLRARPGHRSVTVLRHPLPRAAEALRALVEARRDDQRRVLREVHHVALPDDGRGWADLSDDERHAGLLGFLGFLQRNLNGQTALATHPHWATQTETVAGFARFLAPDLIAREATLADELMMLARQAGIDAPPPLLPSDEAKRWGFLDDAALRKAAKAAYLRDYINFGFDDRP